MPSIECKDARRIYGTKAALDGVTLTFADRSWTTIIGPSGSGKTTVLRAIAGLEPLDRGTIRIGGAIATDSKLRMPPHERSIGFVFQEMSLWPHLTSEANVAMAVSRKGRTREQVFAEARSYLDRLGVGALAAKFPGEVSGGEAQRISIARAIAARPGILLLDEPTAHLDLHLREELMQTLLKLHDEEKLTTVGVMHQIEPPMRAENRIVILEAGSPLFDGRLSDVSKAPATRFTQAVVRSISRPDNWLQ